MIHLDARAAFVGAGIRRLSTAGLRFAGAEQPERLNGDLEILSLSGTVSFDGTHSRSHMRMTSSIATRQVLGGHVAAGCIVSSTAEVLQALLPGWAFVRELNPATWYDELVVRGIAAGDGPVRPGNAAWGVDPPAAWGPSQAIGPE